MKQIVCMKWGKLYGPDYVNKLYGMVSRQITGDFRFVCLTDDSEGIRPEVICMNCPSIDIAAPHNNRPWRKVTLWAKTLPNMEGDWLFLDLDVVITGSLDEFFTYKPEKSFIVMHNWTQPDSGIGNTSVYRFKVGSHSYLHENLLQNHIELIKQYRNSQTYISRTIKEINYWPDDWCILFKVHCVPPWPMRFFKEPVLPSNARIVAFPGAPNPPEAAQGNWPTKNIFKKTYKYIRPTTWVQDIWYYVK